MEAFFSWLGAGFATLFIVAVAVAWCEHLLRSAGPPQRAEAPARPVAHVDLHVDALLEAQQAGDAAERRATLDGAMTRMARAAQTPGHWTETSPMVLHPLAAELPATASEKRATPAAPATPAQPG